MRKTKSFRVIQGGKKQAEEKKKRILKKKRDVYNDNFWFYLGDDDKKALYYGMNAVAMFPGERSCDRNRACEIWKVAEMVCMLLGGLTYRQVMVMFPIGKDFDGEKWGAKDYYSTVSWLEEHGLDSRISDVEDFLWNYYNSTIMRFGVARLTIIDQLRRFEGQKSLMESFADEFGVDTWVMHADKGYAWNSSTCRTARIVPPKKRHLLKVVEGACGETAERGEE